MANTKFAITLSEKSMEMLDKMCSEKGLKRAVIIALAIELLHRREESQKNI